MSPKQQNKLTILVKRFLGVLRILFLTVAVVWPVIVMVVGLNIPADPAQRHTDVSSYFNFRIHAEAASEQATRSENEGELILSGRGEVLLNNTRGQLSWFVSGAISELLLFIFLYGLLTMRKLFISLAAGDTFTRENTERIRKIGYVFVGFNIVSPLLQYFGGRIMLHDVAFNVPGIHLYPAFEFNIGGIFAGFAIIVLSGVLREAVTMHQEQSLTI